MISPWPFYLLLVVAFCAGAWAGRLWRGDTRQPIIERPECAAWVEIDHSTAGNYNVQAHGDDREAVDLANRMIGYYQGATDPEPRPAALPTRKRQLH